MTSFAFGGNGGAGVSELSDFRDVDNVSLLLLSDVGGMFRLSLSNIGGDLSGFLYGNIGGDLSGFS